MADRELRDLEERYRLLMESVKDYAILMIDPEGTVLSWNAGAQRLLGYTEGEIIGAPFTRFFTPEDTDKGLPQNELQRATTEGRAIDENWVVRKDGSRFWASGVTTPLVDGTLRGFAKVFRDLTERKGAEDALRESEGRYRKLAEELEEMNSRKDKFLAMLSHELRNPLAPILTALHVMQQEQTANPVQQHARTIVERQVRQLSRLVDDLLEASRLTAGKIKVRKERTELRVVVERALETARPLIEARRHELFLSLPDQPVPLYADPTRLEQVVLNLLTNAAKYTPEGGSVSLTAYREDAQAVVRVRDTGVGINPELLPRVFDLFTQAEQGLERTQGGLGIGLALVKSLVEMHEGTVQAQSAVGQGSEFVVRLPVKAAPAHHEPEAAKPTRSPPVLRVLVVDDNVDAADSLAMLLRLGGHDVREAHSGPAAVQAAQAYQPGVVLLDIGLPGMDGYRVAERLRQQPETQKAILIALTGYGQESDRQRAREAGFDHHLVKPVDPQRLQDLLAMLTARQR